MTNAVDLILNSANGQLYAAPHNALCGGGSLVAHGPYPLNA